MICANCGRRVLQLPGSRTWLHAHPLTNPDQYHPAQPIRPDRP